MAKFYIENEYGASIDLQDEKNTCVATDVTGLGVEFDSDYIAVGDHFVRDYLRPLQTPLNLSLLFFKPDPYDKLQKVSDFLLTAKSLYLVYKPDLTSGAEYRREVDVSNFLKNGVKAGYLCYQLVLKPTSLFYFKRSTKFEITELEGEKRYDFTWDASYNDYANRSLTIGGGNHVEVAFDLEIYGYTENPRIEVINASDEVELSLTFPEVVQEGEKLFYSSMDRNIQVKQIYADGTERNIINDFDLETTVFFKIPKEGGVVRFTSDTDVMNTIIFTAYFFFKVV